MAVTVGDALPECNFKIFDKEGPMDLNGAELFSGKRVVLFAVPGAFTPTCHRNHLPGYLEHVEAIKAKGIDDVAVVSVNDVHVMNAWAETTGGKEKIKFLSDGNAEFTTAIGMEIDLGVAGMGVRSKRYSMIVEDGKVTSLNVEESPGQAVTSGAAAILSQI